MGPLPHKPPCPITLKARRNIERKRYSWRKTSEIACRLWAIKSRSEEAMVGCLDHRAQKHGLPGVWNLHVCFVYCLILLLCFNDRIQVHFWRRRTAKAIGNNARLWVLFPVVVPASVLQRVQARRFPPRARYSQNRYELHLKGILWRRPRLLTPIRHHENGEK